MYARIKKLFSESFIYTVGNVLRRSFSIVTMPIFTRYMSASEYGTLSLVRTLGEFLKVIYELGFSVSATRLYYDCGTHADRVRLFSTLFITTFGFAGIFSLSVLLLGEPVWSRLVKDISFYPYVVIMLVVATFSTAGVLARVLFRVRGQAKLFVLLGLLNMLSIVSLSVPAVVFLDLGALGPLLASMIVAILFFFVNVFFLREYLAFKFSVRQLKEALAFGLPDMPVRFGNWVLNTVNQWVLQHYWSLALVAVYSVAHSVASVLFELLINAIHMAVQPFYYQMAKEESEEKAKEIFAYVGVLNTTLILFLGLIAIFLGHELLLIFASAKYAGAEPFIVVLVFSAIFQFLFFVPSRVLYVRKKTIYLPPILFLTVLTNVVFCFLLIPRFGVMGAAWATLLAYLVRAVTTLGIAQKIYTVPYNYRRLGKAVAAFGLVLALRGWLPDMTFVFGMVVKLGILCLYPLTLLLLGYFDERELRRGKEILQRVRLRR